MCKSLRFYTFLLNTNMPLDGKTRSLWLLSISLDFHLNISVLKALAVTTSPTLPLETTNQCCKTLFQLL